MRSSTVLAILFLVLFALSFVTLPRVRAAQPTSSFSTDLTVTYAACGSTLSWAATLYTDTIYSFTNRFNVSNAALSSAANPTQTFGWSACNGGVTAKLNDIQSDHIEFVTTFASGNPTLYVYYVMPSGISYTYPQNVLVTYGTLTQTLSYPYYSTTAGFNACTAPCAYLNQSNSTMIVKSASNSPNTIDVYYSPAPNNGGTPNNGCIVNCGGVTTTSTASNAGQGIGGSGGTPQLCIPFVTCPTTSTTTTTTASNSLPTSPSIGNLSDLTYSYAAVIGIVMLIASYQFIKNHIEPNLGRSGGGGGHPHRHDGGGGGPSRSSGGGSGPSRNNGAGAHPTRSKGSNPHPTRSGEGILDRLRGSGLKRRR